MRTAKKMMTLALAAVMLAACSSSGSKPAPDASDDPAASGNKEVVVALKANLMTMDQTLATDGTSFTFLTTCMSGLVQNDSDGVPMADLATWDVTEDGLTYTFHIDENANWSNGEPVTADDFVYSWRRLADPDIASEYSFFLDTIHVVNAQEVSSGELPVEELGVEAADAKTFVVRLSVPCGFILNVLSNPVFFPLNQAYFEAKGDAYGQSVDDLIYSGAYLMTGWEEGSSYTFTKNPDYVNADQFPNETLIYRIILETQTAMLEFEQGNINVVTLTGEMVDQYKDREEFHNRLDGTLWFLLPNMSDETLSNKNLREAIACAIDRNAIAEAVLKDGSVAAGGIVGKSFAFNESGEDYRAIAGDFTEYNAERAKAAFEKAKEELGDSITLELYYEDSDSAQAVAVNIQQMLVTTLEGLNITMNSKPKKTRVQDMINHQFELMLTRWGPDYTDPQTFMDLFITDVDMNSGLYSNAEYDRLVVDADSGAAASDPVQRWQNYIDAEKILIADDFGAIPVYQQGSALMVSKGVEGIIYGEGNGPYRHCHWE